jgi:hypothetical protein
MRLRVAEAYVKVLSGGDGEAGATDRNSHISMSAAVIGLGPRFQLQLKVCVPCLSLVPRKRIRAGPTAHACQARRSTHGSVQVTNTGEETMRHLKLALSANAELYRLHRQILTMPALVPGLQYAFAVRVTCLEPESGCCGDVRISVLRADCGAPLMTVSAGMPISELAE